MAVKLTPNARYDISTTGLTAPLTWAAWVRPDAIPSPAQDYVGLTYLGGVSYSDHVALFLRNADSRISLWDDTFTERAGVTPPVTVGKWLFVAFTIDAAGNVAVYWRTASALSSTTGTIAGTLPVDDYLYVGSDRNPPSFDHTFDGAFAHVRAWTTVLSATQLRDESRSASPVNTSTLYADWPFDDTTGADVSGNGKHLTLDAGTGSVVVTADPFIPSLWAPTTEQILNLDGVRRRADSFRFELCDRDLRPIGELHPDRSDSVPTIQNDTGNNTSRRLTGLKLLPQEAADVDIISDRLRVYLRLQNGAEFRLGTFLWADNNRPVRSWGQEQHAELVDFSFILDQESTRAWGWGRGATISLIMFFLLFRAGFELADIAVLGEEANRPLAEPKSWQPGATWTQMLTDLGDLVGFAPPWVDRDGRIHLDQVPDPARDRPTVPPYEAGTRVIANSIMYSDGVLRAPNDFGAFDSGTDRLIAGRYQLPYNAPHSRNKRGFNIGATESVQGLENQAQANKATRELAQRSDALEELTFASTAYPHDTYEIVPAFGQVWREDAWDLECRSGGQMKHRVQRTFYDVT